MGIVAAFLWETYDKSISYMVVDESDRYNVVVGPKKICLGSFDTNQFQLEVTNTIQFFLTK